MFRFVLILILIAWGLRMLSIFIQGLRQGMHGSRGATRSSPQRAVPLARDPVCGTYVVPSRALTAGSGHDIHYFCSERCRQKWAAR